MNENPKPARPAAHLSASIRLAAFTIAICSVLYPAVVYLAGYTMTPHTASGSILLDSEGKAVGSRLIAQSFTDSAYLWPRPSAVQYNASAAGGSNMGPGNPALLKRANATIAVYGATPANPVPVDLVAASGSGLDPDISWRGALYQSDRIARFRGVHREDVVRVFLVHAKPIFAPGCMDTIVNVLETNIALNQQFGRRVHYGTPSRGK